MTTKALEVRNNGASLLASLEDAGLFSAQSFKLPSDTTLERFAAILGLLGSMDDSLAWAQGDAMLQGEALFGEEAYQAFEALKMSEATRQQRIRVAQAFPPRHRNKHLTWSHHRAVLGVKSSRDGREGAAETLRLRCQWLQKAVDHNWSRSDLDEQLRPEPKLLTSNSKGYVVERVADVAEQVFAARKPAPGGWFVPEAEFTLLAEALGVEL